MNWMINDERYVIQGVGSFDDSKSYPLGLFLSNSGNIEIQVTSLENFEEPIDVYLYDTVFGTFTAINEASFLEDMTAGNYLNRFFITFSNSYSMDQLSVSEYSLFNELQIFSNRNDQKINIKVNNNPNLYIIEVILYGIDGKEIQRLTNLNTSSVQIDTSYLYSNFLIANVITNKGQRRKKLLL